MCATAGASPRSEKHSPKSKPVGDGRVGISQGSPGDVSSAETEHSAPPVPPPGQGKGSPGALGQILPWVDSPHADWKDPAGICPGQLHLSSGSGQDQATSLWCSQLGHNPLSLGGKDADVSGQGRSSPDTFTPAVEAVGGLFSSLPQSGCSWGGSAASTSNLRQGKSDPALTVAVLSWG